MVMRASGRGIGEVVSRKIVDRAVNCASLKWREEIDAFARAHFPVLFVALRGQSRRWLATPEEVASVFRAVQKNGSPNLGVIFDGYSSTSTDPMTAAVEKDVAFITPIINALGSSFPVIVTAGRSMEESIYAASHSDFHLSAQGTTATKAILIANKPGVVIGSRQFGWDAAGFRRPPQDTITLRATRDAVEGLIQTDFWMEPGLVANSLNSILATASIMRRPQM